MPVDHARAATVAQASGDTGGTAEFEIRLAGLKAPTADGFHP